MSCMATVKRYTYPFDPTGRQESNLIRNEYHTITAANRTPQNVLIPGYAPFFRQSLVVTDLATRQPLLEGIDYTCEWPVISASENSATEAYTPIYGGIQFIDNNITGQFSLTYQTIGGQYALDGVAVAQALANQANDPLVTRYEDIIGKPLTFPPLEHVHSIDDFVGFEDLCLTVIQLKEAIELLAREDRDSHPGYDALVDAYFRLEDKLKEHKQTIANLDQEFKDAVAEVQRSTSELINAFKQEVNTRLAQMSNELDSKITALDTKLTGLITALRNTINNEIKPDIATLKNRLNGDEFVKTANVNQTIDGIKAFKKMLHIEDGRINLRKVGENTFSAGLGIVRHSGSGNSVVEKITIKNDAITNTGNTAAYKLEFNERFIAHQDKQLAYQEDVDMLGRGFINFITGQNISQTSEDINKLNNYSATTLTNNFLYGVLVPNTTPTASLGNFPHYNNPTNEHDFVGVHLVSRGATTNPVKQVSQFLTFGPNNHYIRSKDRDSDTWTNELILTTGNLSRVFNKTHVSNIVYTTDDQLVDGVKTFKQSVKIGGDTPILEIGRTNTSYAFIKNLQTNKSLELRNDNKLTYDDKRIPLINNQDVLELGGHHDIDAGIRISRFGNTNHTLEEQAWVIGTEMYQAGNRLVFYRTPYEKNPASNTNPQSRNIAEYNSGITISLPNASGEVVISGGLNHFNVRGENFGRVIDKEYKAPLMFTNASEGNSLFPPVFDNNYYPIMKALYRTSKTSNTGIRRDYRTAGWSYGIYRTGIPNTNNDPKSSFVLHYANDGNNTYVNTPGNDETNNAFMFDSFGGGAFRSSLGKYSIHRVNRSNAVAGGLVVENNNSAGSWIKIKDDGELAIGNDNQTAVKFNGTYINVDTGIPADGAKTAAGLEVKTNDVRYRFEVDRNKQFRLHRLANLTVTPQVTEVIHTFQDKSGTVAHLSDFEHFTNGQTLDSTELNSYLAGKDRRVKNGIFTSVSRNYPSDLVGFNPGGTYSTVGLTMKNGNRVAHLFSINARNNYIISNTDIVNRNLTDDDIGLILQSNNIKDFLDRHTSGQLNKDHGLVTYLNKDQTIDGNKTFSKITNFVEGIRLNRQKVLTGNATKALYDGRALAFETDVTAVNTSLSALNDRTSGITVSGGLKYNNVKVLLQSDYDNLKVMIDGKQPSGNYANANDVVALRGAVDGLNTKYVSLTASQSVNGSKTFVERTTFNNGISIGGLNISKSSQDNLDVINMGYLRATDIYISSDRRLKENIQPIENALDKITKLNGRTFDWKVSGRHVAGFIAQEVEKVIPDMVTIDKDGIKAVNYVDTIAYLVEAIKEQQKQIEALQAKLN